ncbi:aldose 1-epimerase family protein [Epilithonimonas vandammei]|uniref:Aldose 1-epimerase family protein n=1 Tax=Epilithonimonas vandammei TaxID=2487072 RepID=A0A3G8Y4F4_9FLAO|nr:aldose 1-epimerase family protein [Epilithonimonas vandammei]AZI39783.1 aldose 1-epimerase family protein [Epilithonimonas vandammei]
MITIQNNKLKATFNELGAELTSLINLETGKEIMWEGNPDFWGGQSPVLFPTVGALKNEQYIFEGKTYELPRHGFARRRVFDIKNSSENEVIFELKSDGESLKIYPFEFSLEIKYTLVENKLTVSYQVKNLSENEMYFSLGAHPGFAIDTKNGLNYNDYEIAFSNDEKLEIHPLIDNLISNETQTIELENKTLHLSYETFAKDALVMTTMKSRELILRNHKNTDKVIFTFSNFPYFGIWAAKNADFVCLEPWQGIADLENHNQELTKKFGILKLEKNGDWKANWAVEIE